MLSPSANRGKQAVLEAAGVDPRAQEAALLARCVAAARGRLLQAASATEASLFLLAAGVLPAQLAKETTALRAAAESFRAAGDTLDAGELLRAGRVVSLPRFKQGLVDLLARTPA